jgi:hypothetical protein
LLCGNAGRNTAWRKEDRLRLVPADWSHFLDHRPWLMAKAKRTTQGMARLAISDWTSNLLGRLNPPPGVAQQTQSANAKQD